MKTICLSVFAILGLTSALVAPPPNIQHGRWKGFCINGAIMPTSGTDAAVNALLTRASGNNGMLVESGDHNEAIGEISENVFVYACTDGHDAENFFFDTDIHRGLAAMDLNCPRYSPSWAILEVSDGKTWTATNKIVGKSWVGTPVCQGENGGMLDGDHTGGGAIYF